MDDSTTVWVCEKCLRACCWYGLSMCEDNKDADITVRTVGELREFGLEDESYWSDEKFREVHGHNIRPPRAEGDA